MLCKCTIPLMQNAVHYEIAPRHSLFTIILYHINASPMHPERPFIVIGYRSLFVFPLQTLTFWISTTRRGIILGSSIFWSKCACVWFVDDGRLYFDF